MIPYGRLYLLRSDSNDDVNIFYHSMNSHFFVTYILQPRRPKSKPLIDNILISCVQFPSHSCNLTISLSGRLFQFVLLQAFFKELILKKLIFYEINYNNFNEREFNESLHNMNWNEIRSLDENDPNISMNNLKQHINTLLDGLAPQKKLSKREYKP